MNFTKENRTETYMFTVTRTPYPHLDGSGDDAFYKKLTKHLRGWGYTFIRYGRLRDRIGQGIPNPKFGSRCGHVPLSKCDRWDLYVEGMSSETFFSKYNEIIEKYIYLIEYVNLTHKDDFEFYFPGVSYIVSVPQPKTEYTKMKPLTTADVNVTLKYQSNESLTGTEILHNVTKALNHFEFSNIKVGASNIKHEDQHKDLPLVKFVYPSSTEYHTDSERELRVTFKDDNYIEGYEENTFKRFCLRKIRGSIELISLGEKV